MGSHVVGRLRWILVNDNDELNEGGGYLFICKIRKTDIHDSGKEMHLFTSDSFFFFLSVFLSFVISSRQNMRQHISLIFYRENKRIHDKKQT